MNEKTIASLIKSPISLPIRLLENTATSVWLGFMSKRFREASRKPVVWSNGFMPSEFLYASGMIPIFPEPAAGFFSYLGFGGKLVSEGEKLFSSDLCSFYKAGFGMMRKNILPKPSAVVVTSHICNGSVKFFEEAANFYRCPFYLVNVPYGNDGAAIRVLNEQLIRLSAELHIKPERLRNSIKLSNEARKILLEINKMRMLSPSPMNADESLGFVSSMYFSCWGSPECVKFYKALLRMLKKRKPSQERFRLLWLHHVRPYFKHYGIVNWLEEEGVKVVIDESSYVWEELNPDDPYTSLSRKILSHPYGTVERRINLALNLSLQYRVDGAIHFSQWGCRQSSGSAYLIKDALKRIGIPTLILHGDAIDERNYETEQTKTRIKAFIELLEGK